MRCAVLGDPIAHSLSPVLHRAGVRRARAGLGATTPSGSREDGLAGVPRRARRRVARPVADHAAQARRRWPLAADERRVDRARARRGGEHARARGRPGRARPTTPTCPVPWRPCASGTTARSPPAPCSAAAPPRPPPAWRCASSAPARVTLLVRSPERAAEAVAAIAAPPVAAPRRGRLARRRPGRRRGRGLDGPGRRPGRRPGAPAARSTPVVFEVLYDPWPTPLAASAARSRRAGVLVGGLDLLVHQAALQFELFTGVDRRRWRRCGPRGRARPSRRVGPRGEPRRSTARSPRPPCCCGAGAACSCPRLIGADPGAAPRTRLTTPSDAPRRREPKELYAAIAAARGWPWRAALRPGVAGALVGCVARLGLAAAVPAAAGAGRGRAGASSTGAPGCCPTRVIAPTVRRGRRARAGRAPRSTRDADDLVAGRVGLAGRRRRCSWLLWLVHPRGMGFGDVRLSGVARHRARLPRLGRAASSGVYAGLPARRRRAAACWRWPRIVDAAQGVSRSARSCWSARWSASLVGRASCRADLVAGRRRAPTGRGMKDCAACCVGSPRASPTARPWSRSSRGCPPTSRSPPPTSPTPWPAAGSATAAAPG